MTTNTQYTIKTFDALTLNELYAILRLRSEVFVVEQHCPFLDMDNKDQQSLHFMGWQGELLAAYTRILPPGLSYELPSIGRVVSSPLVRGTGIGRELMQKSIEQVNLRWGTYDIKIGAQLYLKQFYASLGFLQTSEIYLEDNIQHIEMILYKPH